MNLTHAQSLLQPVAPRRRLPALVASLTLASTLLLSGCATSGGAQKMPLSDEEARYVTTGTYGPKSAQEAGKQSKQGSGTTGKFLGNFAVEGLLRLLIP